MFLCCAALLLMHACKKNDHWPLPPGCAKPPACTVEKMLVSLENDSMYGGPRYPEPYKFYRTYGPDGRINYISAFTGPMWTLLHFAGTVNYSGNSLLYINGSIVDTMVAIRLNKCGQPEYMVTKYTPTFIQFFTYEYDRKGRLSRINWSSGYTDIYEYDKFDNITRIHDLHNPEFYIKYTYDYSKPAKGIYLEQDFLHFYATDLLESFGLLNLQSQHLRTTMTNTYEYPTGTHYYFDHVISNGYVQSYKRGFDRTEGMRVKTEHIWNCGAKGSGGAKY